MCDSGTNLMHLRHGPDGEPGKDPNGEQSEDQDEAAEDLDAAFPNRDRHGGDDALRLLDLHGRITKSFHPNGHFLLALHQVQLCQQFQKMRSNIKSLSSTRNLSVFLRPEETTRLASPQPSPCQEGVQSAPIRLLVAVFSAPQNTAARAVIRCSFWSLLFYKTIKF